MALQEALTHAARAVDFYYDVGGVGGTTLETLQPLEADIEYGHWIEGRIATEVSLMSALEAATRAEDVAAVENVIDQAATLEPIFEQLDVLANNFLYQSRE